MPKQLYKTVNLPNDFHEEVQIEVDVLKGKLGLRNLSIAQMLEIAWRKYELYKDNIS